MDKVKRNLLMDGETEREKGTRKSSGHASGRSTRDFHCFSRKGSEKGVRNCALLLNGQGENVSVPLVAHTSRFQNLRIDLRHLRTMNELHGITLSFSPQLVQFMV